jgi:TM2 domain-containing membrane protein YozV
LILCLFFGVFGAHRFYVGKIGTGILQLFTLGGYFIWTCLDLANILNGEFTDSEGKIVRK